LQFLACTSETISIPPDAALSARHRHEKLILWRPDRRWLGVDALSLMVIMSRDKAQAHHGSTILEIDLASSAACQTVLVGLPGPRNSTSKEDFEVRTSIWLSDRVAWGAYNWKLRRSSVFGRLQQEAKVVER
jgi:hypothetical protein